MLAYILAVAVGLSSLALYMAAFFFPELHRKSDFYWSGLGLFYALILWVCAGRITGAVLLGQTAGVALLGWFAWQTISLRYVLVAPEERTEVDPDLLGKLKGLLPTKLFTSFTNRSPKTAPEVEEEKDTSEAEADVELELPQDNPESEVITEISSETEDSETIVETIPDPEVADGEVKVETAEAEVIASDIPVETEEKQDESSEAESQLQPKPQRKEVADTPEPQVTFEERVIQQRPTDK